MAEIHPGPTDVLIVGAGFAGSLLALTLARQGIGVALADPHSPYPPDFRCEKLGADQAAMLDELQALAPIALKAGIPAGDPVSATAPLYMGFKSSLTRNQATEDDVTIPDGTFADGTTMHASYMRLSLDDWYGQLSEDQRVARMYAPQVTPQQVTDDFTTDAESDPNLLGQAISRYGVIGHSQTSARVRRAGRPIILRRDFNTTDGGQAGLHFVSLQRTIADFVTTRAAMNATSAQLQNPVITDTVNNGINSFIFVLKRGNYLVPTRAQRSFPLVDEGLSR